MKIQNLVAAATILLGQEAHGPLQAVASDNVPSTLEQRISSVRENAIELVTCATIDVGSGATKITVADVDRKTNRVAKILYQGFKKVSLRQDLSNSKDNCLSPEIEDKLIQTLKKMQNKVSKFQPSEWAAVGTSVFRNAANSLEFLERVKSATGIAIRVVPQSVEGEIGFASAVAASGEAQDNVIAWDFGSGSFQISTWMNDRIEMYGAEFGFVSAEELLFAIRGQPYKPGISPNPVYREEALELIEAIKSKLPPLTPWISANHKRVISFGDKTSIFSIAQIATGKSPFTKNDVMEAILQLVDKMDEQLDQFPRPYEAMIGLILVYAVMDHCGMQEVSYYHTNGGCEGMLVMPRFWQ